MKVALIRQAIRTGSGGAEEAVIGWARTLLEAGHEVHLVGRSVDEGSVPKGASVHRLKSAGGISLVRAAGFSRAVSWFLVKNRGAFDIVHSFERTLGQDVYRAGDGCHREWLDQRSRAETPFKNFCIAINPLHLFYLSMERKIFDATPLIIANSERGRREIMHHYGVAEERLRVVYTGVDRDRFSPENRARFREAVRKELKLPAEAPVVLFVGGGFKRKGLEVAVTALTRLEPREAYLVVAGRGEAGPYRRAASERGLEGRVRFLGQRSDVEALYGAADVFCLPTLYDPCANACLEALSSGLPVVTSEANGASEAVLEGRNGFVVRDPLDEEAVGLALARALALDASGVWEATRESLRPYDWELHREQMLACYEEVLARKARGRAAA